MLSYRQRGFTLIEVVVTATFVATVLVAIVGVFVMVGKLNRQARNLSIATQLVQEKVEIYRNKPYSSIAIGTLIEDFSANLPSNFGSPKSAVVNTSQVQDGLLQIDIAVTYREEGTPKNVQVTTLVAERGINK